MEDASTVVLVPCANYGDDAIAAVRVGMELLEGDGQLVKPSERTLIKPNFLSRATPDKAITTHPSVFEGVARYFKDTRRGYLFYGDSPSNTSMARVADESGIGEVAARLGIEAADFETSVHVDYPDGHVAKGFNLAAGVLDADAIVCVSKMKTHALERITGAVKIGYGFVQGNSKKAGHAQYPSAERFAAMLADLNLYVKPRLHVMDGIVAMEGNGPAGGDPAHMGVLLFSTDPVAIDVVFCKLIGLDPALVSTCAIGAQFGLGVSDEDRISVMTPDATMTPAEAAAKYGNPGFDVNREPSETRASAALETVTRPFSRRPFIVASRCVRCGRCVESCPVQGGAVRFSRGKENPPVYDYSKCIRCFCCQEMCPHNAIVVKRGF